MKLKLSENQRKIIFAALAYALFFSSPVDKPSDMNAFVARAYNTPNIALFYDVRGADSETARIVYQCGVDIIGGQLFGSKEIDVFACDDSSCLYMGREARNESLSYAQVKGRLPAQPYVMIKPGAPSTRFYENHMEIDIDSTFNGSCKMG